MSQEALDFGRTHRVALAYRKVLRALADTVEAVGLLQAAGACDARKSELNDALHEREGRYVRLEWVLAIVDIAPPDFKSRIYTALAEWQGCSIGKAKKKTPEERLAEYEKRVAAKFGQAGLELVEELSR